MKPLVRDQASAEAVRLLAGDDGRAQPISSRIAPVEVLRASRRFTALIPHAEVGRAALRDADGVLAGVHFLVLDQEIVEGAARMEPAGLRSLAALHLAS